MSMAITPALSQIGMFEKNIVVHGNRAIHGRVFTEFQVVHVNITARRFDFVSRQSVFEVMTTF